MLYVHPSKPPGLVIALTFVPISLMVLLSAPAWLCWPFLNEQRRSTVLQLLDRLIEWTRAIHGQSPQGRQGKETSPARFPDVHARRRVATLSSVRDNAAHTDARVRR
jgi:hypothetical protein